MVWYEQHNVYKVCITTSIKGFRKNTLDELLKIKLYLKHTKNHILQKKMNI